MALKVKVMILTSYVCNESFEEFLVEETLMNYIVKLIFKCKMRYDIT